MKVLFAVNSENISDSIIKKYQKDYREILSYKNVYYFNAIQKEIQQDKSYDRIIISEDLEPFSTNNYEAIDKFIFEKMDGISDEAHDFQGNEIPIILICSDRHTKGTSFLVKLFGISVYNALIGNDRRIEEVCRLINKPRTKKEAKVYYKIDTEDVNYKAENEGEVSEAEIQNIIAYFKKLGKNADKYVSSFENIAGQYSDEQLKIIINCLPMNVKAVLEEKSAKYQEIMTINGVAVQGLKSRSVATKQDVKRTGLKIDIIENKLNQTKMTKPIVIPSSVKATKSNTAKKVMEIQTTPEGEVGETKVPKKVQPTPNETKAKSKQPLTPEQAKKKRLEAQKREASEENSPKVKKRPVPVSEVPQKEERKVRPVKNEESTMKVPNKTVKPVRKMENGTEKKTINPVKKVKPMENDEREELTQTIVTEETPKVEPVKKGRGRPRKNPIETEEVNKTKKKRGRPAKKVAIKALEEEEDALELEEVIEPISDLEETEGLLPGLEEQKIEEKENELEDLVSLEEEDDTENIELPDLDEIDALEDEEDALLPGMDEDEEAYDEFEDYDEYGQYKTKGKADSEDLEEDDDLDDFLDDEDTELPIIEEEEDDDEEENKEENEEEFDTDILDDLDDESDDSDEDDLLSELDFEEEDSLEDDTIDDEDDEEEFDIGLMEDDEDDFDAEDESDLLDQDDLNFEEDNDLLSDTLEEDTDGTLPSIEPTIDYSMSNLNSLMTKDKKIVTFIGSTKNGVSFLVNNLAELFASMKIDTAILDMTKNKNSYYMYTNSEENLRKIAYTSIEKLKSGVAEGIRVKQNLTVYTALPNDGKDYGAAEPILSTLVQNHSLVLIDCDFDTDPSYFASAQEIYLVQSMDVLTIQPLTAFLRDLKTRGVLEPEKVRVVINKEIKVKKLTNKLLIAGMSVYNDPAMSFMTELFNKDNVKYCSIPFEDAVYARYLEAIMECKVSIRDYSKNFMNKLKILGDMVYPLTSKQNYSSGQTQNYAQNNFSNSMNSTLNKMKKKY